METLIVEPKNKKQLIAIKAFLRALDVNFRKDESPSPSGDKWFSDPKNVAIVEEGVANFKKGSGTRVNKENLKEFSGL